LDSNLDFRITLATSFFALAGCGNNELISQVKRYFKNIFLVRKLILTKKAYGGSFGKQKLFLSLLYLRKK
jgi:hypothetical protein